MAPEPLGEDGLGAIYDRFAPRLFAVAMRLLSVREEAEECVQDLFVNLARTGDSRPRIEDLSAYLFSSIRRSAIARSRAQERREQLVSVLERSGEPAMNAPDSLDARALHQALADLPDEQREVVTLKIDGQLTFAEIALVLRISQNTAASRYRYALEKIRLSLEISGATP
jgi:RNA polymerase sigma-70 factor (ECF subfamily)